MLGRMFEAVLGDRDVARQMLADPESASEQAIKQLNDFIGHRPVATLESQKIEPRQHEWVRPVPLYVEGAGVANGPYQELVKQASICCRATDDDCSRRLIFPGRDERARL